MVDDAIRAFLTERGVAPHVIEGGLEYLVRGWERTAREVERGYALEIEDWLNDLDGRQLLAEVEPHATSEQWELYTARVTAADEIVRRHTLDADACLWGDAVCKERGWTRDANWWYWRAPRIAT